jgi:hypothetical protein
MLFWLLGGAAVVLRDAYRLKSTVLFWLLSVMVNTGAVLFGKKRVAGCVSLLSG